jgi:hypothetical protein
VTIRENSGIIAGLCILIILTVSIAACTTPDSGTNNPPGLNPSPAGNPQSSEPVTITVNSADKLPKLNNLSPRAGYIFLVLNITIKNNDVQKGFVFLNKSVTVLDLENGEFIPTSLNANPRIRSNLTNPIVPPVRIGQHEAITGQVVFAITDSAGYRLNLTDSDNEGVSLQQINFGNLTPARMPVSITINSVEKRSVISPTKGGLPMPGHIFVILNVTLKNNDLPGGFYFTGESIILKDFNSHYSVQTFNDKLGVQEKLENPIILPKRIAQNSSITGNILFATTNTDAYGLSLFSSNNTEMWSKIIYVR